MELQFTSRIKRIKNIVNCLWLINQIIDENDNSKALKNQGNKLVFTERLKEKNNRNISTIIEM
jgi:hypothetical protein